MIEEKDGIRIVVMGNPVTQLRPIFNSHTKTASDPKKCRDYKKKVGQTAKNYLGDKWIPLNEPLKIDVTFYREIPASWSDNKKKKAVDGKLLPVTTPDTDNYLKCWLDGNTGVTWKDDNCIIEMTARKKYSSFPRTEMKVYKISELTQS